jgi:GNAT superfamily N-acetyltransferase
MRLQRVDAETYAAEVLPLTAELWSRGRDFERYVAHTQQLAGSGFGRRHYSTHGLYDAGTLVASFKRYDRAIVLGRERLRAIGIGAVYTSPQFRGRGYASAMLAMALDAAREEGSDAAYLFSDIHPQFYAALGFLALPSRAFSLRADSLDETRIEVRNVEDADWPGIRKCYEATSRGREWSFVRTPLVWENIRLKIRQIAESAVVPANLVVRRGRGIAAYALGARALEHDAFILDELGFDDVESADLVAPLLRSAAGDLRRIVGWLPPALVRSRLPRASVRRRTDGIFMGTALSAAGKRWLELASERSSGDGLWHTDHV